MYITITSGRVKGHQVETLDKFLSQFLPRLEKEPGVIAIYHYLRPEREDDATLIIWEDQEAVKRYRESPLMQEVNDFERENNMSLVREGYPLTYATHPEKLMKAE